MLKKMSMIYVLVVLAIVLVACGDNQTDSGKNSQSKSNEKSEQTTVTISGSTSVGPLAEKLASKYEQSNNAKIEINQIGSSAGITNAINGVSQIGMSSRDLKQEEKDSGLEELVIAYDGITVISHKDNKVKDLTLEQIKEIFTGKITNWKEVGGEDLEIVVVSREDGSGSRDAFQEIVGYEASELVGNAIIANGSGNIKTTVANNKQAIGFISFEYIDDSIHPFSIDGIEPTADNVLNNKYAISRPFIFVYKQEINEAANTFMDFILSEEGQKIVSEAGAIPLQK